MRIPMLFMKSARLSPSVQLQRIFTAFQMACMSTPYLSAARSSSANIGSSRSARSSVKDFYVQKLIVVNIKRA